MADHCQSLPASLWEETYKLHPWYILIKDDVPRVDYRSVFPKCAEKGELYYYDASSQTSTKSYREKESKSKKVIMTAVCSTRLQVQWSPHIFAPLNDKEKELLEAIPSTKQRFVTYNDQKDYLLFGAQLQINDPVQLCAGALRVPTANDVHGKLKYIGPLKGQKGTMFGIHLSTNYGDCNGTHRSTNYFKCDSLYGIFLPINKLVPLRKSDKLTQQETTKKVKHCRAAALGTEDVPQPTMLKIGVTVEIKTILQDSPQKKTLVKGTIVNMAVFEGNTLFAVELDGFKKPAVNTNGFYKGKAFFALKNPKYTVTVEQSAIRQIHSSLTSGKEEVDAERDYNGKEQFDDERRTMSYNFERGTNQFGETPSKVKGKSARKSEDQEDENNIMLPASSNMVKILPSSMNMNEHHFVTNSRLKGGTSWPSDNHQHDGKPPDGSKGFISNFRSMWKSPDPPPYPFSVYEGQAIVTDSKLFHGLISELELTDKWRASTKRDQKDFFRFESVLQSWWKDIHEGHQAHLQSLLMFLGQYGREDIRDHIEKVPDRGCFDETVLNTVILSVTNSWKLFVAELGVKQHELTGKLTQDMNPYDCLRTAFDIWNTNERGCNKLGQLLKACRAIGRDTLADEIEQGLNESVLRRIGHQIKKEQWKLLGEKLLISEVRQDAFREKFKLLPERIYRMFSYWSMLQSFDANKIEMLASVLYKVDLGHVAEKELYKGLRQHELENIASLLSDNWQKLAPVFVKFQDIDYMMEQKGDSSQNCLRMLKIWRGRKIQADDGNLKETFIEAMCQCDLNREARQLYDGPPPYPFSDFHIEVITDDKKLCQGLIRGLQLENKWKAEKGREAFFRLECVLQHWWTQIYEESKTQMQEFKILLVQYGREDLRDHIDKVPDRGMFDDTILNTAIFLARKDWRKFASELGMKQNDIDEKLKQAVLPEESLRIVFHIWYKQEQGCSKLSKLVKACRSIGQHTLAEEIEQGLSYDMLRKIAHQIELKSWQRLADHLLISPVRQDAFREKFKSLPSRVYHMLSYWSMIQPFGIDKVDGLASALYDVKLGYVAQTLLYRDFGDKDCEPVEGYIDPPKNVEAYQVGMFKGIQGVHNSSYMDATLFSMFAYNSIFDAILFHDESTKEDITQVKDVLRTTIVNPLRSIGYVRGDHMLYFCNLLRGLDILQGLQAEEKDPAEFIQALLQELINVKPFLQISQGQNTTMESFMYQIFLDKQDNSDTSTVSDLLHLSFLQSDLKLAKVPECLIIQLHKYGKKNKLYDWIIPSLEMDINTLIRDSPRQCSICGKLAFIECKDCTPVSTDENRDVIQSFCVDCYLARHKRKKHKTTNLSVTLEFTKMFQEIAEKVDEDNIAVKTQHLYPEHRMELFSVVCIETSHYMAFVKTCSGDGEQWVFFDSMADGRGDQHGYNIPEVAHLSNFRQQMESDSLRRDMKRHNFPKKLKRLLSDAYICFYRPVKNRASSHMDTISQNHKR
ncbi:uncharacterized protein [Apostichopus japonicus]|uniref:uncharacterized protein isoform X2 n=1 Tax=Stichopus japonicus TaxID=307972 RepID=UPI003AB26400